MGTGKIGGIEGIGEIKVVRGHKGFDTDQPLILVLSVAAPVADRIFTFEP
jgi:hypothetical protein